MTRLADLLDLAELEAAIKDGLVRAKRHDTLPLTIYNYAEKAVHTRTWTPVTRQCRGLVVHDNGDIIARPWPKFFNLGEHGHNWGGGNVPVEAVDKLDGSLGILVHAGRTDPLIATRGSFNSDQAKHATRHYTKQYRGRWEPAKWLTYLFEIVYPDNRIVCDYGQLDDLILLGAVDNITGEAFGPHSMFLDGWPGPRAGIAPYRTLAEVLSASDRPGAEGYVCRITDGPDKGLMVKVKQADYVAAHRIVTGLNARTVWECYGNGTLWDLIASLPDEFHRWTIQQAITLGEAIGHIEAEARRAYMVIASQDDAKTRGGFAAYAKTQPNPALLFALLDGKDIRPMIHRTLKPSGAETPRLFTEDAA